MTHPIKIICVIIIYLVGFKIPQIHCAKYQFIQLPSVIQLVYLNYDQNISATTANDCVSIITSTTIALAYLPTTKRCLSISRLYGFNSQVTGNVYYLKMPGKCGQCATSQESKIAIMNYVYELTACPDTIFTYYNNTRYCVGNNNNQVITSTQAYWSNYGAYTQGAYQNGTLLMMSRALASIALTKTCPFANSTPAMFNDAWFCYTQFTPLNSPTTTYITQNVCGSWISGGTLAKFVHAAEIGYYALKSGSSMYTGMVLSSGTTYTYYDGTPVPTKYINWNPGAYPRGKQLVLINSNFYMQDMGTAYLTRLMCRNNVTST